MFFKPALLALLPLVLLVAASPAPAELETRATVDTSSHCGDWDTVTVGPYSLLLDLWGKGSASSGQQCANLVSLSGSTVAWKTTWTWTGGSGVKSFTNIQLNQGLNKQLSAISSIPVCPYQLVRHSHANKCFHRPLGSGLRAPPARSSLTWLTTSSPPILPGVRT